jgi:hypothetical protein
LAVWIARNRFFSLNWRNKKSIIGEIMKKYFVLLLILAVTLTNAAELKVGKAITIKDKSSVSKILKEPAKFEGKTVLVEGKILDVCQDSGCWIELSGEKAGQKIKVQFEEGKVSVPKNSKGKFVSVQGIVEEINAANSCGDHDKESKSDKVVVKDEAKKDCGGCSGAESKEEGGSCCGDEETASAKTYQIKGLGAVIK